MLEFSFIAPLQIIFGEGSFQQSKDQVKALGSSLLLVASRSVIKSGRVDLLLKELEQEGIAATVFDGISGEPTLEVVQQAIDIGREHRVDVVMGIGGGSVIDVAKASAGMIPNEGELIDYIEGVGRGLVMSVNPLPLIAVPTTAGTGAEVTKNAVIASHEMGFKRSFRDERLLPKIALVDPELTLSVPQKVTAYAGMDAITQLIESYISKKSKPMTDALAISGLERAIRSIRDAYHIGNDIKARTNMAYGSMLSGLCLANSGLGAVHGIAAAFGAVCSVPHGMACAVLLPHVMTINAPYIGHKIDSLCKTLTGRSYTKTDDNVKAAVDCIKELSKELQIPDDFKSFNIPMSMVDKLASSCSSSSLSGNPKALSQEEIHHLISSLI